MSKDYQLKYINANKKYVELHHTYSSLMADMRKLEKKYNVVHADNQRLAAIVEDNKNSDLISAHNMKVANSIKAKYDICMEQLSNKIEELDNLNYRYTKNKQTYYKYKEFMVAREKSLRSTIQQLKRLLTHNGIAIPRDVDDEHIRIHAQRRHNLLERKEDERPAY